MSVTIILPSWQRPHRTERAVMSVLAQSIPQWELLVIGDCCSVLDSVARRFDSDPRIAWINMPEHEGKFGTQCLNHGLSIARHPWVCFLGNDDYLKPSHVARRINSVSDDIDFVHHDAIIRKPDGDWIRSSCQLQHGSCGGSELIVRTELARKTGFRSGEYGHDWQVISDLIQAGARHRHCESATYIVTHMPGNLVEEGID